MYKSSLVFNCFAFLPFRIQIFSTCFSDEYSFNVYYNCQKQSDQEMNFIYLKSIKFYTLMLNTCLLWINWIQLSVGCNLVSACHVCIFILFQIAAIVKLVKPDFYRFLHFKHLIELKFHMVIVQQWKWTHY